MNESNGSHAHIKLEHAHQPPPHHQQQQQQQQSQQQQQQHHPTSAPPHHDQSLHIQQYHYPRSHFEVNSDVNYYSIQGHRPSALSRHILSEPGLGHPPLFHHSSQFHPPPSSAPSSFLPSIPFSYPMISSEASQDSLSPTPLISGESYQEYLNQSTTSHSQQTSNSSDTSADQNQHHRNPFLDKSLCVVCGDRARGCNFGAITCASCKEFFRRNAFKFDKLRCYFQNKCEINMHSRRFCAACRLIKCNQSGMKSEYIMSEAEKQERQMKIHERKMTTTHGRHSLPVGKTVLGPEQSFSQYESMCIQASFIENPYSIYPISSVTPTASTPKPSEQSQYVFSDETESEIKAMMKKVKIIRESNYYPTMFQIYLHSSQSDRRLEQHEECKLKYLTTIVQIMQAETVTQMPTDQKCIDLLKLTDIVTLNFIKMCKKLSGYNNLSLEDQIQLIKGRVMESLILWSIMIIDFEKELWEILDLERNIKFSLKLEMLRDANPTLYQEHRQYVSSFDEDWRFNENIMSLLMAITFFDAEKSRFENPEAIRTEKREYCKLLRRYLGTLYEETAVEEKFRRLLNQIEKTEQISDKHMRAHYDVLPDTMCKDGGYRGFIMEIFDLNN